MHPISLLSFTLFILILGGFVGFTIAESAIYNHCATNGEYTNKSLLGSNLSIECKSAWWNELYGSPTKQIYLGTHNVP